MNVLLEGGLLLVCFLQSSLQAREVVSCVEDVQVHSEVRAA